MVQKVDSIIELDLRTVLEKVEERKIVVNFYEIKILMPKEFLKENR